ncbi:hypothetical protein ACFLU5_13650 [Bacteroidota bacterium]
MLLPYYLALSLAVGLARTQHPATNRRKHEVRRMKDRVENNQHHILQPGRPALVNRS